MKRELGIARCGMACCLCCENITCKGCRKEGFLPGAKTHNGAKTVIAGLRRVLTAVMNAPLLTAAKDSMPRNYPFAGLRNSPGDMALKNFWTAWNGTNKPGLFITGKTSRETMTALTTWTS